MRMDEIDIFRDLVKIIEQDIETDGGCDHSVNICTCHLVNIVHDAHIILKRYNLDK